MKKIAFVCQRYGLEVNGGAELLCRQLAERLNRYYDVEVITTCAVDYVTWKNEYEPGEEYINDVLVRRFTSDFERDVRMFGALSCIFADKMHSSKQEDEWLRAQGPVSEGLLQFIRNNYQQYQAATAHDEPPVHLRYYKKVFKAPKGIIYQTTEEQEFVQKKFDNADIPSVICGAGVDAPSPEELPSVRERFGIGEEYITYVGRIDESKGCKELFRYFRKRRSLP